MSILLNVSRVIRAIIGLAARSELSSIPEVVHGVSNTAVMTNVFSYFWYARRTRTLPSETGRN